MYRNYINICLWSTDKNGIIHGRILRNYMPVKPDDHFIEFIYYMIMVVIH